VRQHDRSSKAAAAGNGSESGVRSFGEDGGIAYMRDPRSTYRKKRAYARFVSA
jgi:hypothetical protein